METGLTVISKENVQIIAQNAPQMYSDCKNSHDKCLAAGQALIAKINAAGGKLNDELDQECATYIERVKKTLKKMNDARSPLTKMLDEFKTVFTTMENDVNVTKGSTIPAQVQALRNAFAAEKHAEEERRRQEEYRRLQAENVRKSFRVSVEEEYRRFFDASVNAAISGLSDINSGITLENYIEALAKVQQYDCSLPADWCTRWSSTLRLPFEINKEECKQIMAEVKASLEPQFKEQYTFEVEADRDNLLNRLPSKKRELEAIAKASAEEAERRREEIAAREAEEARRKEAERQAREEEERKRAEVAKQNSEMEGLFEQAAASTQTYIPKTSVKKKVNVLNVEGFSVIFSLWWAQVGYHLSMDELAKTFKTQITYCEKVANDKANPFFLESEHIEYVDEVKAK